MSLTLEGKSKHYLYGFNGPLFVLKYYAGRVVPRALFGERALGGPGANYRGDSRAAAHHQLGPRTTR